MAVRTKSFSCGHKGLGRQCHRCLIEQRNADRLQAAETAHAVAEAMRVAQWDRLFRRQAGDSHRFPRKVGDAALRIAEALAAGMHFKHYEGRRMRHDRTIVRVDLPGFYRLVAEDRSGRVLDFQLMSHETYNRLLPGD
ncbi:MAG: hypothetical protein ABI782_13075 [Anaerolineaceae bacterium]